MILRNNSRSEGATLINSVGADILALARQLCGTYICSSKARPSTSYFLSPLNKVYDCGERILILKPNVVYQRRTGLSLHYHTTGRENDEAERLPTWRRGRIRTAQSL